MKIALIGPFPPHRGGISQFNHSLAKALRAMGHEVLPLGFSRLYPTFLFPGTSEFDPKAVPEPDHRPLLTAWNPFSWIRARILLRQFGAERLIFSHWHPFFAPAMSSVAKYPAPVSIIVHNALPHEKEWVGRLLNPMLFRRADFLAAGAETQAHILSSLAPGVRCEIVGHPAYSQYDEKVGSLSREEARQKLGLEPGKPILMHLGLVRTYKGLDILLRAMSELKNGDITLHVAGEFYDDYSEYERLVEELDLKSRVTFDNRYLSDEELGLHLAAADALALPYRSATQSGVAMMALASGTPVIASRVGSLGEVVRGEYGLLVPPEDATALAGAIDTFFGTSDYNSAARRKRIRKSAAMDFPGWEQYAETLINGSSTKTG